MRTIETSGKTVEEAVGKALVSLGIKKHNAAVEVLSEPSQGLLGLIGTKTARVEVSMRYDSAEYLENFLIELLDRMKLPGKVAVSEDTEKISASISGNKVSVLIGRRGKTLNDLQYLMNTILRRQFEGFRKMVIVDVEGYRARRESTLTQLARSIARKVSLDGREQVLEPMTPQERRIIHLALQENGDVTTYSEGEEPYRKVVIAPR